MDRKECYGLTHPLSKMSGYATAVSCVVSVGNEIENETFARRAPLYTTRPGAPAVVSGKHDRKLHALESFSECTGITVMSWRSEGRVFQAAGPQ